MNKVRVGIVGIGNMGSHYFKLLAGNEIDSATVTAVCDSSPARLDWARGQNVAGLGCFESLEAALDAGAMDAVMIITPHYDHPRLATAAFRRGVHVLCDKPAGVYASDVREMNAAATASGVVYSMMFNQRTIKTHQKMRELMTSGELGTFVRMNWIITDWMRTQHYYDSGGWRATWAGEGGGVLVNQTPHQLDLWQWICGMPRRVRAACYFGKFHKIEVEDEATVFAEYENGATAVFIASTGEAPGTNRLEIIGDRGKLVLEGGTLTYWRSRVLVSEYIRTSKAMFDKPEIWKIDLPTGAGEQHKGVLQNWVHAIAKGVPLLAPGVEGLHQVELANAIQLSGWTDEWVTIPVDSARYRTELEKRIRTSTYQKPAPSSGRPAEVKGSF
jgi:predicted dehydrogenase